ncbi:MAG: TonB-dependent receptor [Gammaproteobacteria bacterium]
MLNLCGFNPPARTVISLFALAWVNTALAQIEEVVVTAQKRAEDVQDVPISISTFTGDFMEDSGIDTLQELGQFTPNLSLTQSSQVANNRIIMRGVGSVGNNAIEPSVAVFIDGVYYPRPASVVGSLTDLEMVEVLRGPQGTLFGRNASMGALNIRTRKPTEELEGQFRISMGNFGEKRFSGAVGGGMTDNLSGRLSFHHTDRDGYGDNHFVLRNNKGEVGAWNDTTLRGKIYFTPADNLEMTLTADYTKVENEGTVIEVKSDTVLPQFLTTLATVLSPVPLAPLGPTPDVTDTFDFNINQDNKDNAVDEQWGISADIQWKVGGHTIRSITSYRDWSNDTFESVLRLPADLLNRVTAYDTETFSQELQLLSPTGGKLEYVAGLYFYDEDYAIDQNFDIGPDFCSAATNIVAGQVFQTVLTTALAGGAPPAAAQAAAVAAATGALGPFGLPTSLATNAGVGCSLFPQAGAIDGQFNQDLTSYAAFGQLTFNVTDTLRLTGGVRWTRDEKDGSFSTVINNFIVGPTPTPPPGTPPGSGLGLRAPENLPNLKTNNVEVTWLVNSSYNFSEDIMIFASASTGFKSGGFNSEGANRVLATNERVFDSETVDNYEAGFKSSWFDNRLIANVTYFHTEISDFQDRQFDGVNFIVQNAGDLTQQGVEMEFRTQPIEQLFAVLGVSYLDSEFDSFPNATNLPAIVAASQAAGVLPPPRNLTGLRNHFSPKWQLSLVAEWSDALPRTTMKWFVRSEYNFTGDQNLGAETNQNPQTRQEAYNIVNARAGLRGADDKWEVSTFIRNAFDAEYCQTMFNQPIGTTLGLVDPVTLGGLQRCVLGAPQTWGVEAAFRF